MTRRPPIRARPPIGLAARYDRDRCGSSGPSRRLCDDRGHAGGVARRGTRRQRQSRLERIPGAARGLSSRGRHGRCSCDPGSGNQLPHQLGPRAGSARPAHSPTCAAPRCRDEGQAGRILRSVLAHAMRDGRDRGSPRSWLSVLDLRREPVCGILGTGHSPGRPGGVASVATASSERAPLELPRCRRSAGPDVGSSRRRRHRRLDGHVRLTSLTRT